MITHLLDFKTHICISLKECASIDMVDSIHEAYEVACGPEQTTLSHLFKESVICYQQHCTCVLQWLVKQWYLPLLPPTCNVIIMGLSFSVMGQSGINI